MKGLNFSGKVFVLVLSAAVVLNGCKAKKFIYKSPPHYDFSKPFTDKLDLRIKEVSGIVWDHINDEFITHNDEKGTIFYLDRDTKEIKREFSFNTSKGDYEDIAMINNDVYVLKSNGELFRIVTDSSGKQKSFDVGKMEISGPNDFETLYYDPEKKALVMLCKNCEVDDKKVVSAFAYYPDSIGFDKKPLYSIDISKVEALSPRKTSRFEPSAARIHPILKKLFILSSASNQLVIADTAGNVEAVYMLATKLFPQAEGITFKSNGDMYISNEAAASKATLLKFVYTP